MTHKPAEEYYLHDHGDGNGWQVASRGPGRFGVMTSTSVNTQDDGLIELVLERYYHGALSTTDTEHFMITPEEAREIGEQLIEASEQGEDLAVQTRDNKTTTNQHTQA